MVNQLIAGIEMLFLAVYATIYVTAVVKQNMRLQAYNHIVSGLAILAYALSVFLETDSTEFMLATIYLAMIIMVEAVEEYIKKTITEKG